jgi:transposase
MTKRTRRNHSADFKAKVALGAVKGDKTIAQLSDQHGVHVSQITNWKEQLQDGAAGIFDAGAGAAGKSSATSIDLKALHAKIGELTLEIDFLEGALSKAGLLNAKR